jgi:hypothetical protein
MHQDYTEIFLIVFSVAVIAVFGYQQFNRWTDAEARSDNSDSELLAFAPPRSFTSLWRFAAVAAMYCLTLIVFYALLLLVFRSGPGAGYDELLKGVGITKQNAWLAALFVVTGLSHITPGFSNIERSVREVMHAWAVVPTKAWQMADELASPTTTFEIDEAFLQETVLPRLAPLFRKEDFATGRAGSIAQKWCRLNYLRYKFAPPETEGLAAHGLRSPYTTRFQQDLTALGKEINELAGTSANAEGLRNQGGSPVLVALSERIDSMLHRLYVLMCCRAFASVRSLEGAVQYFHRSYGIGVREIELAPFPTDPIFDTLTAVTLAVLIIALIFYAIYGDQRI